jgi:hypothetical protein
LKILHYPVEVCPKLVITMSTSPSEGEILTIKQVAEYLKVTESARSTAWRQPRRSRPSRSAGLGASRARTLTSWIKQQSMEGLDAGREDGAVNGQGPNERWEQK